MNIPMQSSVDDEFYWWDEEENDWLYDEYGNMIEATVCLCAARNEYECCCGAWDIPLENDYE